MDLVSMVNLDYVYEINWGAIDPKYLTRAGGGGAPGGGGGGAAQGGIFINSILAISMGQITNAIEKVAETRAENGAEQNAVREAHEKLRSSLPNLEDAHGRIMDADIATETTELAKHKIMREAGVSMHAQANRLTYLGLTLMGLN